MPAIRALHYHISPSPIIIACVEIALKYERTKNQVNSLFKQKYLYPLFSDCIRTKNQIKFTKITYHVFMRLIKAIIFQFTNKNKTNTTIRQKELLN